MAKPRPLEKKRQKTRAVQAQLPGMPPPLPPGTTRVLPMQLQIGDRMTDSTGEWEVVGSAYSTGGGKIVHARVQSVGQPASAEVPNVERLHDVVAHALRHGFDWQRGGFYSKGSDHGSPPSTDKVWWVQAEGLVALSMIIKAQREY